MGVLNRVQWTQFQDRGIKIEFVELNFIKIEISSMPFRYTPPLSLITKNPNRNPEIIIIKNPNKTLEITKTKTQTSTKTKPSTKTKKAVMIEPSGDNKGSSNSNEVCWCFSMDLWVGFFILDLCWCFIGFVKGTHFLFRWVCWQSVGWEHGWEIESVRLNFNLNEPSSMDSILALQNRVFCTRDVSFLNSFENVLTNKIVWNVMLFWEKKNPYSSLNGTVQNIF